jgi:hypothetical protein
MDVFLKVFDLKGESESMFRQVLALSIVALLIFGSGLPLQTEPQSPAATPGRPWVHRYDRTLTIKMMLALKQANGRTNILLSLDQALEVLKKIDSLSVGIPKIVYVVGWQDEGHDSKYPAFFEVNAGLKRPRDATALDSLEWFMREANRYHTTVSVHINLRDAYKNSPLWQTYVDHDLLQRGVDGQLIKGGVRAGSTNSDRGMSGGPVRHRPKMAEIRRSDEQTSASEPNSYFQGADGIGCNQGRKDQSADDRASFYPYLVRVQEPVCRRRVSLILPIHAI